MSASRFFTLKEVSLNNNCPECYSNTDLKLTFKQKLTETLLYKAITNETRTEMFCASCNTKIFPISWNDAIDRVVAYHYRALTLKPKSVKLKVLAWVTIGLVLILVATFTLFATNVISF